MTDPEGNEEQESNPDTEMIAISHAEDPNLDEDEMIIFSTAEPIEKKDNNA